MSKKSEPHLNYVTMFAFLRTILLVSVWIGHMVIYPYTFEEGI